MTQSPILQQWNGRWHSLNLLKMGEDLLFAAKSSMHLEVSHLRFQQMTVDRLVDGLGYRPEG